MKTKLSLLALAAMVSTCLGQPVFAPQTEAARFSQVYNSISSMVSTRPDRLPTTNAICNIGVTAGDGLAGEFYWDSSSVASTNTDTFQTSFPGLETTGRWIRISGGSGSSAIAAITSGTISGTVGSANAIATDTVTGTNASINFSHSTSWTPGASASRFTFSNIPTGTNEQRCYVTIIGNPSYVVTNVVDAIGWHGSWGVLNEITNHFLFLWNGASIEGFQDFNHGVIAPAQITANQNDYGPTGLAIADEMRISSDAARTITGMVGRPGGQQLLIENIGSFGITLSEQDAGSTATNRNRNGADVVIGSHQTALVIYSVESTRWKVAGNWSSGSIAPVTVDGSGNMSNILSAAVTKNALGVTPGDGLLMDNTTAAGSGAQQISPSVHLRGRGYASGSGGSSQQVDGILYLLPVTGTTSPTETLIYAAAINGGSFTTAFTVTGAGLGTFSSDVVVGSSSLFRVSGKSAIKSGANGTIEFVDAAATSPAQIRASVFPSSKTANYPVTSLDAGTYFNNIGAGGAVNFTLPTAAAGLRYSFTIQAAQTVTITAGASTTIRIGGTASAAAGNITSSSIGNTIVLYAISATEWYSEAHEGTWTIN